MTQSTSGVKKIGILLLLAVALWVGYSIGNRSSDEAPADSSNSDAESAEAGGEGAETPAYQPAWWTCSMHPSVKLPSADMKCPICFMDLIPMEDDGGAEGIPEISFSERARFLAEVETAPVERRELKKSLRLVGKIRSDETKLSVITAWVPGRLDRLFVDYTGMEVRKGDHLVEIYSPELYSAQQELLQAIRSFAQVSGGGSNLIADTSESLIRSARGKLVRLGLTEAQVDEIIERGEPTDTLTLYSPTSGIVTAREGTEGMYVDEGSMIYTIADLSTVWLLLDVYESDLQWVHYGQPVTFETEASPGESFSGVISFISPVLDERSRTVSIRVNVANPNMRLKPGMFARAVIEAIPSAGGKSIAPEMAGKWLCPMHPEVVEDLFGFCPVCEMPLETAKALGYVTQPEESELPLAIPETAPLRTGKRAVVYVEKKNGEDIAYEGREVVLGPRANGWFVVMSGLEEGERVVTRGNFKIDSALQIQDKPSMMNPKEAEAEAGSGTAKEEEVREYDPEPIPEEFRERVRPVVQNYLNLQTSLAADSFEEAARGAGALVESITSLSELHLPGDSHGQWMTDLKNLRETAETVKSTSEMEAMREAFHPLTQSLEDFVHHFGHSLDFPIRRAFCPMALDAGASWFQADETIANPYYGAMMLRCGEIQATYPGAGSDQEAVR